MVSLREPAARYGWRRHHEAPSGHSPGAIDNHASMKPDDSQGLPHDVLIVEDDAIIALDFEETIAGFGVRRVRTAGNAARAMALIAERAPDFALLDIGLAVGNSFVVAEKLQALQIPFVFITGYGRDMRLPEALKGTPMLPKPCTSDLLKAALRQRRRPK